jgi:uroporphyrinogen decarboxylase
MGNRFAPYEPDFDRLRKTLMGGQADRIPIMELGIHPDVMADFLGHPVNSLQDKVEFYRAAGYDYIKLSPLINLKPEQEPNPDDDLDRSAWGTEGSGVITRMEDFDSFAWPEITDEMFRDFEAIDQLLPDEMQVIGQYGDIFTFTWELMGFERFSFALVEDPDLVTAVFNRVGEIVTELFRRMAGFPRVQGLFYSDDIAYQSGLMISPLTLRSHLFPWMKEIGGFCREHGIPFVYHSDGKFWEVLDDLHELGVNALQPIEPLAWDIRELKDRYGDTFSLIGNVDVDLLARGTTEAIRNTVDTLIEQVGPGGGYCVGSGNTIPDYVPVQNFRAMIETVWQHGAY